MNLTRRLVACFMLPLLLACNDDGVVQPATQLRYLITSVSGDGQPGKTGVELAEPLVVRVTNQLGEAVRNHQVTWSVTSGEGVLENRWSGCPSGGLGDPLPVVAVSTDSAGLARVSFMPTWFGPVTITATSIAARDTVSFTTDATDVGVTLTIESGNHQHGLVLDWIQEPLVVRVSDGDGLPVPHVAVLWKSMNEGSLSDEGCAGAPYPHTAVLRTGSDGLTVQPGGRGMRFQPQTMGTARVLAALPAAPVAAAPQPDLQAALFTVDVDGILIVLGPDWFGTPRFFPESWTLSIGGTMAWVNRFENARIRSTSVPPGGMPFDSGDLEMHARFAFVPEVTGTWEYIDEVSQLRGRFTAR